MAVYRRHQVRGIGVEGATPHTLAGSHDSAPGLRLNRRIWSASCKFLRVNNALCEIVGYSHDELTQLSFQAITHPDDPIGHMKVRDEKGLRVGGFGLLTVLAKVDELVYNEKKNEVIFVKYLA